MIHCLFLLVPPFSAEFYASKDSDRLYYVKVLRSVLPHPMLCNLRYAFFLHKLKCMKYCRLQLICLPSCVKRNHGRVFCSAFDIRPRKVIGYFVVLCLNSVSLKENTELADITNTA